jgi:uncharacterized protein (TIGR03437 family)
VPDLYPGRAFVVCLALIQSAAGAVPPTVGGVITASAFGGSLSAAPGSFIEIYGADLANTTRQWSTADFDGLRAPTSLDGVTVTVGGQSAFVYYVSPGQVDALLPSGISAGRQALTVGRAGSISAPYSLEVSTTQPGLWSPASFQIGGKQYVAAVFPDYRTFVLPPGTIPGVVSRQARPGETIILLGTGFGAVTPDIPAGRIVTDLHQLVLPLTFSFDETPVTPAYAGLMPSGGAVGLYQFNLVVPAVPDNDAVPLSFTLGGAPGGQTLFTAVNANGRTGTGTASSISVNGVERTYTLYLPANYQPGTSGLVILMHGMTGHAVGMESWTQMIDKADQAGFALACPQSTENYAGVTQWNYFYYPYWAGPEPDDTGFLRQLIDTLQGTIHPDPKRIYLTGHSAGAFMSYRGAVELSSRVAAIASVSGTIFGTPFTDLRVAPPPRGPVSVLMLHGDVDTAVPYCGVSPDFRYASQDTTFEYWSSYNGCTARDTTSRLCNDAGPWPDVSGKRATHCLNNTEVRIYKLIGGVHTWYTQPMNDPKQVPYNPALDSTVGVTTNDLIWNFFATHPKQ